MPSQKENSKKKSRKVNGVAGRSTKKTSRTIPKQKRIPSNKIKTCSRQGSTTKRKVSCRKSPRGCAWKPTKKIPKVSKDNPKGKTRKNDEFVIDIEVDGGVEDAVELVDGDDVHVEADAKVEELAEDQEKQYSRSVKTIFDLDDVDHPLVGTPSEVQKDLDRLAIRMQKDPTNRDIFNKIVAYMHKYILGLVFKKYSFVMGYEETDMYQEALIALSRKAIPAFRRGRGMSFLNFAKMCINRHLITILHASKHRCKDIPINTAISLDHNPMGCGEDDDSCPLSNVIVGMEPHDAPYEEIIRGETLKHTLALIRQKLSGFEQIVLDEYLDDNSYKDSADNISEKHGENCNEKSIDNALLRIRKKAEELKRDIGRDSVPILSA